MAIVTKKIKKVTGRGRPTFYTEVVLNDKGMELLTDAWAKNHKGYFVVLTYWHQILDPHAARKKVLTLAELVICPIVLQVLKKLEEQNGGDVLFKIRRTDLEGYDGWDRFDYD